VLVIIFVFLLPKCAVEINEKILTKIKYYDCKYFERKEMKIDEYFLKGQIMPFGSAPEPAVRHLSQLVQVGYADNKDSTLRKFSQSFRKISHSRKSSCRVLNKVEREINKDILQLNENIIIANGDNQVTFRDNDISVNNTIKINNNDNLGDKENKDEIIVIVNNNFIANCNNNKSFEEENKPSEKPIRITLQDYSDLTLKESIIYDKREFKTYFLDNLIECHRLLKLIFKASLFHPRFIRINEFIFDLSLNFSIGALLFTDSYIDARAMDPFRDDFFYSLYTELPKTLLTIVLVCIARKVTLLIIYVPRKLKNDLNETLKLGHVGKIKQE
jgi:hypothetical protein